MDASTLMMITMNFLDHNSEKAKEDIAALEKELLQMDFGDNQKNILQHVCILSNYLE